MSSRVSPKKDNLDSDPLVGLKKLITSPHFHLLKVGILPDDTKSFINRYTISESNSNPEKGIRERWFGNRSDERVRHLIQVFHSRFVVYETGFSFLQHNFDKFSFQDWNWIIAIHMILSDPTFRWFVTEFLPSISLEHDFSRNQLSRDLGNNLGESTKMNTKITYSSKLLTASKALKIIKKSNDNYRKVPLEVSQLGFYYILFLLQSIDFDLNRIIHTKIVLGLFQTKQDLKTMLDTIAMNGYITLTWYGDDVNIQLKALEGFRYEN